MGKIVGPRGDFEGMCGDRDNVNVEFKSSVAIIGLNRPEKCNALTYSMGLRLLDVVVRAAADTDIRAVVLIGNGGSFCAGDDIIGINKWCEGKPRTAPFHAVTHDAIYLRVCEELVHAEKPVIAGLTGVAAGAGLDIACAADLRVVGEDTRIGSLLLGVGHVGNAVLLPRIVGIGRATQLFLSQKLINATEAYQWGLASEIVAEDQVNERAVAIGIELATDPTRSIGLFKDLRERAWGQPVEAGMRLQDHYHILTHDGI